MNNITMVYSLVLLLGVFISSVSQVMLKKAAIKQHSSFLKEYLNPLVIFAYILFVGTTLLSIVAYKGIPLSMGPVLEATSYLYITFFGVKIFHEHISRIKVVALGLIIIGILVYTLLG